MLKNINIDGTIIKNVDENVYISGQIRADMINEFKKNKIELLINNRPDNEDINQLKSIDIKELTENLSIDYYNIPFSGSNVRSDQIHQLADLLKPNDKKVLIFCKSGARSALIWGLSSVIYFGAEISDVMQKISNLGYDSSILPNMVEYFSNI
tara:strand:+ start:6177 stop:6635 length:459 start_codon:yes stop_codon:yes gene_type:complete